MVLRYVPKLEEGKTYTVEITDLNHNGEGVGRYNNQVVFIPGAVPGDQAITEIIELRERFARGLLVRVLEPSPDRIPSPCSLAQCGGCQLLGMNYQAQLAWKTRRVREAMRRVGRMEDAPVRECLAAPSPYAYRNKAEYHVAGWGRRFTVGFTTYHSHHIVPIPEEHPCHLVHPVINGVIRSVTRHTPVDVQRWLRSILVRHAPTTGQTMLVLVFDHRLAYPDLGLDVPVPGKGESKPQLSGVVREAKPAQVSPSSPLLTMWKKLKKEQPSLASFGVSVNTLRQGPGVIGEVHLVAGQPAIEEVLDGIRFRISPASFFQVNTEQAVNLYHEAIDRAALTGRELALDVYCGIGTIALLMSRHAREVLGIEIIAAAVEDAKANARLNAITNARFVREFAEKALPGLVRQGNRPDVVVLDPPRAGVEKPALQAIIEAQPERVVYVSCDPETLARDLAILAGGGYTIKEIQPVDMFPQTSHVENVALVVKKIGFNDCSSQAVSRQYDQY